MKTEFNKFLNDPSADDMFITGRAGTGKTTEIAKLLIGLENYVVCAFTHKACEVLRSKLHTGAPVQTLHSFLKKRPTINSDATRLKQVNNNTIMGESDKIKYLFIDEYSMIGEKDLMDIRALQGEDDEGNKGIKVVWIGDPYQLPPVGDTFTLEAYGKHQVVLTKIHRQDEDNPLLDTLSQLVSFIEGSPPVQLKTSNAFIRGQNLIDASGAPDSILLAYTNKRVQELNYLIQGYDTPVEGDLLFSPTTRDSYTYCGDVNNLWEIDELDVPFGRPLKRNTKYKTLEHLLSMEDIKFCLCAGDEKLNTFAYVFGHSNFLEMSKQLKVNAVVANKNIVEQTGEKAAEWAAANRDKKLAKIRAKAWRDYLTFNSNVICLDFNHAMTVHKSQGSTYHTVLLDTKDIGICADRDYETYLKLMYVGISRASHKVITN